MKSVIEIREVSVQYRRPDRSLVTAVSKVNLTLNSSEILGLVGESGCGKSSLGSAVVGLTPISAGAITFDGDPVITLTRRTRPVRLRRLQMVFQDPYSSLNPRRKIGDQLADGLVNNGMDKAAARKQSAALLERVGLTKSVVDRYPHEFSGGQRQRIAIARALSASPIAIVADEPISALDASAQAQVANLLVELVRETSMGMIFISHDLSVVRQISDRTAVMYLGKIVEVGPTADIWARPAHPYTKALIRAVPRPDGLGIMPLELAGEVPDPRFPPSGCRFHPRCPLAKPSCSTFEPQIVQLLDGRQVACILQEAGQSAQELTF
jgi:oligopeptide/dipeptide ABC transporter ATP-binding protein